MRMRWLIVLIGFPGVLLGVFPGTAWGWGPPPASPHDLCRIAIASAERAAGVPAGLMSAIGVVESGRREAGREQAAPSAYPWTINAEGVGSFYASKAEAIAAVVALRAQGVRSIDVGCMQVNLMHHGTAFASLEEAFDPGANARYAATFLLRLLTQTGSWPAATAGYHSLTPELGEPYARKVLAVWRSAPPGDLPTLPAEPNRTSSMLATFAGHGLGLSSPGARLMRLPLAGAGAGAGAAGTTIMLAGAGVVGRGLDAYRAAPVRIASRIGPGPGMMVGPGFAAGRG